MRNSLKKLWENSTAMIERFNIINQPSWRAAQKLKEETVELLNATNKEDIANETVDVIVTALNYARSMGVEYDDIEWGVIETCLKNDAKNLSNHVVVNGLITRKPNYKWDGTNFIRKG